MFLLSFKRRWRDSILKTAHRVSELTISRSYLARLVSATHSHCGTCYRELSWSNERLFSIICRRSSLIRRVLPGKESCGSINQCLIYGAANLGLMTSQFGGIGSARGRERPPDLPRRS